jgi:hypothetical protein
MAVFIAMGDSASFRNAPPFELGLTNNVPLVALLVGGPLVVPADQQDEQEVGRSGNTSTGNRDPGTSQQGACAQDGGIHALI